MQRRPVYSAMLMVGILGLTASSAAKDHYQGHGQYHQVRDLKHSDRDRDDFRRSRDHSRAERREHERRDWSRRERERREWAKHHHISHGNHAGWERGRYNPHDHDAAMGPAPATNGHVTRPVRSGYSNHSVRTAHVKPSADIR